MVDFTLAQIQGPQTGALSGGGRQPVQQPQPSAAGAALGLFSQLLPTGQQLQARAQQRQEEQRAGFVEQFSQQQLQLAEAVDTGALSSQEARMRMRANFSAALSNNPMLMDDITAAQKSIIGTSGLGKVAAEGTEAEQRQFRIINEASSAGWVTADMGAAQAEQRAMEWQRFNQAIDDLSMRQAQLTFRRGQVGLQSDVQSLETGRINQQSARINLQNAQDQRASQNDLGIAVEAYYPKFRDDMTAIQQRVERGELTPQEGVQEVNTAMADINQIVGMTGANAGASYITSMTSGFSDIKNLTERVITGQLDKEVYETQLDKQLGIIQLNLIGDPDTAAVVSTSRLFQGALTDTLLAPDISRAVTNSIDRLTNEGRKPPDPTSEDAPTTLRMLRENMDEDRPQSQISDEEHHRQTNLGVNRFLQGIEAYSSAVQSPTELNEAVDFLASDSFREYVQQGNVSIDSNAAQGAKQVFQQQYEQEVIPLVQEAWRDAQVDTGTLRASGVLGTTGTQQAAADLIQPVFAGTGMSFRSASDNPRVQAKVRDLNRQVSPVVNRLVRVGAHLERHENYEQIFRQLYEPLFSTGAETEQEE